MVPVSPIINDATFVFIYYIGCIYFTRSLYLEIFLVFSLSHFYFLKLQFLLTDMLYSLLRVMI
jgi:hypothetical protein